MTEHYSERLIQCVGERSSPYDLVLTKTEVRWRKRSAFFGALGRCWDAAPVKSVVAVVRTDRELVSSLPFVITLYDKTGTQVATICPRNIFEWVSALRMAKIPVDTGAIDTRSRFVVWLRNNPEAVVSVGLTLAAGAAVVTSLLKTW